MKALNITQYTGIAGLQYQDVPEPTPGPGQVTIRAEYAGVGYVDALLAEGMAELPLPWAPGIEAAGRIHALGEGVTGLRVGDKVAAPLTLLGSGGGFGQICLAQANLVAPLPAGMNPALAAVVPANTPTALAALERTARLQPANTCWCRPLWAVWARNSGRSPSSWAPERWSALSAPKKNASSPSTSATTRCGCAMNLRIRAGGNST
ncbi:alcohol dehydrogenase catalytic domain-containing protein [Rothia dentocariosa]|uniref:quinone oxidoreductase family protein n=1 Tax=Rothia dentocariosa TaxID=2047 RepID=UPI0028E312CB|nr:alcohol dehydrogenase catalytic domain-containing protein [Rothia dentocariosa]